MDFVNFTDMKEYHTIFQTVDYAITNILKIRCTKTLPSVPLYDI